MLRQLFAIARITFVEAVRQPIFFVLVMAGGLLQIFNTLLSAYSMEYTDSAEVVKDNKMLLDMGLATTLALSALLAAFIATNILSREIDNHTALTVISKPLGRPVFVLGKFLGASGALLTATTLQIIFLLYALRHGVLSTSADMIDGPVLLFASLAVVGSIAVGAWGNFFYGWVFSSATIAVMLPASIAALAAIYLIDKEWRLQPITTDLKPQVLLASAALLLATTLLTALAIAASTRLKQVMTIALCAAVFLLGLMSNYLLGRWAYRNEPVARIAQAQPVRDRDEDLADPADLWTLRLREAATVELSPGLAISYGPVPNGLDLAVRIPPHGYEGDPSVDADLTTSEKGKALVVREVDAQDSRTVTIANAGGVSVKRLPKEGDYLFTTPTRINALAWLAWAVIPNLQFFWLVDAVAQAHPIPLSYMGLLVLYTLVQTTGLLAVAVALFQKRDVG
ncbi:MAG: ABC transporter permease [Planctomycetota bacterium]|nr:MAG: ABC transporter permease [Planctomycetota bacterium]